jgi:hypothetical protein
MFIEKLKRRMGKPLQPDSGRALSIFSCKKDERLPLEAWGRTSKNEFSIYLPERGRKGS